MKTKNFIFIFLFFSFIFLSLNLVSADYSDSFLTDSLNLSSEFPQLNMTGNGIRAIHLKPQFNDFLYVLTEVSHTDFLVVYQFAFNGSNGSIPKLENLIFLDDFIDDLTFTTIYNKSQTPEGGFSIGTDFQGTRFYTHVSGYTPNTNILRYDLDASGLIGSAQFHSQSFSLSNFNGNIYVRNGGNKAFVGLGSSGAGSKGFREVNLNIPYSFVNSQVVDSLGSPCSLNPNILRNIWVNPSGTRAFSWSGCGGSGNARIRIFNLSNGWDLSSAVIDEEYDFGVTDFGTIENLERRLFRVNSVSSVSTTGFVIQEYAIPPKQLTDIDDISFPLQQSALLFDFGDFFRGQGYIRLFIDELGTNREGIISNHPDEDNIIEFNADDGEFIAELFLIGGDILEPDKAIFGVSSLNIPTTFQIVVNACQDNSLEVCVSDTFLLTFEGFGDGADGQPVLISTLSDFQLQFNEGVALHIGGSFSNYQLQHTSIRVQAFNQDVTLTSGNEATLNNGTEDFIKISYSSSGVYNIESFEAEGTATITLKACENINLNLNCVQDSFNVFVLENFNPNIPTTPEQPPIVPQEQQGFLGGIVNFFASLFPQANTLNFAQKMFYVFSVLALIPLVVFFISFAFVWEVNGMANQKMPLIAPFVISIILMIIAFFMFIAINYIHTGILILIGAVLLGLSILNFFRGRNG